MKLAPGCREHMAMKRTSTHLNAKITWRRVTADSRLTGNETHFKPPKGLLTGCFCAYEQPFLYRHPHKYGRRFRTHRRNYPLERQSWVFWDRENPLEMYSRGQVCQGYRFRPQTFFSANTTSLRTNACCHGGTRPQQSWLSLQAIVGDLVTAPYATVWQHLGMHLCHSLIV